MSELLRDVLHRLRNHRRITWFVLGLAVLGSAVAGLHLWTEYHLHAARQALDRYAFDEAQRHLNLCLAVPFRDGDVYLLAARTSRRRDSLQDATKYLEECRRQPGMTKAVVLEHLLLTAQQGGLDGIEGTLYGHVSDDGPEAVLVLEALAKEYLMRSWRPEALECLNKLLVRQPGHPQALLMRARLEEELALNGEGEHEANALRDYEKAVEAASSFEARLGRAGALYRLGRPWDALLEYDRLCSLRGSDADALLGLARCRSRLGEVDKTKWLLDELLERHPDHWEALLDRGRAALHAGQPAEAEKWLRRAADLAPGCEMGPLRSLGQCLEAQHKVEEARRCRDRLSRRQSDLHQVDLLTLQANRDPYNVALRYEIADKLMRLGRERDGVAALYLVLEQQPQHQQAHAALADYFQQIGQSDRAARHRHAANESTPAR